MTYTLPPSWGSAKKLSQYPTLTVVGTGAENIYMTEIVQPASTRNSRISTNANSAETMEFWINEEAVVDSGLYTCLTKSILGGWYSGDNKKHIPMKHPRNACYAHDLQIASCGPNAQAPTTENPYAAYNIARLIVSFETLPYEVNASSEGDDYNYQWIELRMKSAASHVSTPLGWISYAAGTYANKIAIGGSWYAQPQNYLELTIHQVPHSLLFGSNTTVKPICGGNLGQVNQAAFGGCAPDTLLFDSLDIYPYKDWLGTRMYDCKVNLIYNDWGWNTQIDPGGSLQPVRNGGVGGLKPFLSFSVAGLINSLNPVA